MTDQLFTALMVLSAVATISALCWLARNDRDALLGKRLIDAAGSLEMAELAITQARDIRALNEALRLKEQLRDEQTDALMRRGMRALSNNVVHLRFRNRGQAVHFEPPGAA